MAVTQFQLVNNQTFLPADIVNGVIFESPEQVNGTGTDLSTGIRVIIDYHDLQSSPGGAALQAVVGGKSEQGQFYTLAYQFCQFATVGFQQRRQLLMSPELSVLSPGVDNIVFIGNSTVEQISSQQGILPKVWRVRVSLNDPSGFFVSVRMSIYGERFNQPTLPTDFRGFITDGENLVTLGVK